MSENILINPKSPAIGVLAKNGTYTIREHGKKDETLPKGSHPDINFTNGPKQAGQAHIVVSGNNHDAISLKFDGKDSAVIERDPEEKNSPITDTFEFSGDGKVTIADPKFSGTIKLSKGRLNLSVTEPITNILSAKPLKDVFSKIYITDGTKEIQFKDGKPVEAAGTVKISDQPGKASVK